MAAVNPPPPFPSAGQPGTPASGGRSSGFWILVIGGCLGVCGVGVAVVVFLAGVLAGLTEESPAPGPASISTTGAGPQGSAPEAANGPDDFTYKSKTSGLEYIAPNRISAEGVRVTLVGDWREDHRNVVFRLLADGRYELRVGGGALSGRTKAELVASSSAEQGTWKFEGSTLTLTPDQYNLSGIAEGKSNSGRGQADGPRQWTVEGVTIEYTPEGSQTPKYRPGLRINGPGPSWHYPPGNWNWVLRSAW